MLQTFNPQNANLQVWVGDRLWPRDQAKVSVFDSAVQGGDAVWEGLRVYSNGIFALDYHLDRLFASAHAMAFANVPIRDEVRSAIFQTLEANGMRADSHIRLTLTRGEKITSGMDPRLNQKGCTLIVLAEWKKPVYDNAAGVRIVTSAIRRNSPQFVDSKIHHNNLINNILAKIQANVAGADDALMLDERGFVAEMNGTNLFMIRVFLGPPRIAVEDDREAQSHILNDAEKHHAVLTERAHERGCVVGAANVFNELLGFCDFVGHSFLCHPVVGKSRLEYR